MSTLVTTVPMVRNASLFNISPYLVKLMVLVTLFFVMLLSTGYAHADIFASAKTDITSATGKDSTLYLAITALSLIVALITGITTKNWFAAIGGFAASMIFISAGMKMVGLS
ncbi:hypothetical protein [Aliivibrio fischeri]|uniref:Uncharacterized protein n=1 Tax=Aliivibrio fischeri TaxID=668 RepID=A0A844P7M1_ALIFS|nr:hypothetical protein [Aliivibrio fischeri]MUK51127.1 hypothetical protein [Aliivibrio fischeri]